MKKIFSFHLPNIDKTKLSFKYLEKIGFYFVFLSIWFYQKSRNLSKIKIVRSLIKAGEKMKFFVFSGFIWFCQIKSFSIWFDLFIKD